MANCTLQSLFREPQKRLTDRVAFAQAVSRISSIQSKREEDAKKPAKNRPRAA
ncbi:MAG: hypothetical protein ACYC64_02870 [Armatimonadota bacterium]